MREVERAGAAARKISRLRFVRGAAAGISVLSVPGLPALPREGGAVSAQAVAQPDALHRRVRAELGRFTGWLQENGAAGYVGEVGWPDDYAGDAERWNALAEAWYGWGVSREPWLVTDQKRVTTNAGRGKVDAGCGRRDIRNDAGKRGDGERG